MRLKTTKECIQGVQLYCLKLKAGNYSFHNDYFTGFYKHQGDYYISATKDFQNEKIKVWKSVKSAEKQALNLFELYLNKFDDVIEIVNEYGETVKTIEGYELLKKGV